MIRNTAPTDARQICEIYNHYIRHSTITFEEEPVSIHEMQNRILTVQSKYFWLVYETDGLISGYAYAGEWLGRPAYRNTVETSVYIRHDVKGKGIGKQLYIALLNELKNCNYHVVIGGIALPNEASVALHESLGYKKVAHFSEVGYKFNCWIDVGYWQLLL